MKKNALIVEAFGHGIMGLNFAKAYGLRPVAFSMKETEDEFNKDVETIFQSLYCFGKHLGFRKASWTEREELLADGWNVRQDLLDRKISLDMWRRFANTSLQIEPEGVVPQFKQLREKTAKKLLFSPQKLKTDGICGATATEQSLPLAVYGFLKYLDFVKVLGQHFHKVNDLESVKTLAEEFDLYIPGLSEDHDVFGIRGVPHWKYMNMYDQIDLSVGTFGTQTWIMLTCFPNIRQVVTCSHKIPEDVALLNKVYNERNIFFVEYDNEYSVADLQTKIEKLVKELNL